MSKVVKLMSVLCVLLFGGVGFLYQEVRGRYVGYSEVDLETTLVTATAQSGGVSVGEKNIDDRDMKIVLLSNGDLEEKSFFFGQDVSSSNVSVYFSRPDPGEPLISKGVDGGVSGNRVSIGKISLAARSSSLVLLEADSPAALVGEADVRVGGESPHSLFFFTRYHLAALCLVAAVVGAVVGGFLYSFVPYMRSVYRYFIANSV